jgi:hypothetical protein
MKVSDLYGEVANRLTLVLKQPYSEHELTVFQLECVLDCLTVFLGGLLAEARRNEMPPYSYRVIILGTNWYAVRRFANGNCEEAKFDFDAQGDPQLRETEKRIIAEANRLNEWAKV